MISATVSRKVSVIPIAHHYCIKAFKQECRDNHMRLQEEVDDDCIRVFYGDEYMGYFNKAQKKGFLYLEPLTPRGQFLFH